MADLSDHHVEELFRQLRSRKMAHIVDTFIGKCILIIKIVFINEKLVLKYFIIKDLLTISLYGPFCEFVLCNPFPSDVYINLYVLGYLLLNI